MSEKDQTESPPPPPIFRPVAFLLGLVLGLAMCSLFARWVSSRGYHETFTRFHVRLSPEAHYYPTIEEMCGIVRARCRPDQVLVIVGGNSIFHGVGQPVGKIWTEELQRLLGDRFVVINFAFRGALCTDGGAVVADVLRKEYPRQIYVANAGPFGPPAPYGLEPYRYLFREARARGLLEDFGPRDDLVAEFDRLNYGISWLFELHGTGLLDRVLRYRDLWNWVGYNFYFTIKSPHTPNLPQAIWARKKFRDEEGDYEITPFRDRFTAANRAIEMKIVRGFSELFYLKDGRGEWQLNPIRKGNFMHFARGAVPDQLKPRTLIMLSRNSPYYLKNLTKDEMVREDAAYRDGVAAWQEAGYAAAEYGRAFAEQDFGDRTHLTASGGRKLAEIVAREARAIADRLGYLEDKLKR